MIQIKVEAVELYDDVKEEFITSKEQILQLEHSLVSLSKWESKWKVPFLSKEREKTGEEMIDYIRCMTITQNVDPTTYSYLTVENINEVNAYIEDSMTATTFSDDKNKTTNREIVTSEVIYHWMIAMTIPFECQKWHLNRLLTLINVCNIKNKPPKSRSKNELLQRNKSLNAARRSALNTKG